MEALTLADRIVVMRDGYVQQIASPEELYAKPNNLFVANFIGTPPMNFFDAKIDSDGFVIINEVKIDISNTLTYQTLKSRNYYGKPIILGVRPEAITIERPVGKGIETGHQTTIQLYELLGSDALVHFNIGKKNVLARINARQILHPGEAAYSDFDVNHLYFFDKETEEAIYA
jgi:multiple sugar transport system ATP-binding protein